MTARFGDFAQITTRARRSDGVKNHPVTKDGSDHVTCCWRPVRPERIPRRAKANSDPATVRLLAWLWLLRIARFWDEFQRGVRGKIPK